MVLAWFWVGGCFCGWVGGVVSPAGKRVGFADGEGA